MSQQKYVAYLHVKEIETGKIVHSVGLRRTQPRHVKEVLRGMLMRIDRDRFYVDDSEVDLS